MRLMSVMAALVLSGSAFGQVDEAAKAKLQGMVDAAKQAQAVSYSVVYKGEGGFSSFLPETRADVAMLKGENGEWKLRITGTKAPLADTPMLDFVVVVDGNMRMWQDDKAKIVYERPAFNARAEQLDTALLAALRELYQASPFEKDLGAETIKLEPSTVINGIPVDVVFVDPGHNQPQNRFYIGVADRMPRKVEQIIGALGSMSWTLSNVLVNPPISATAFKVDVPDGYTLSPAHVPPPTGAAPQGRPPAPVVRERVIGTSVDDLAPEFALKNADGTEVSLASLKGNIVVVTFWGTWSAPSKRAVAALQDLHAKYQGSPVKVLALAFREGNEQNARDFVKEKKGEFTLLLGADEAAKAYKVKVPPTFFVIGREGEILHTASGFNEETMPAIEAKIDAGLGKGGNTGDAGSASGEESAGGRR